ncbi:hypothetical protein DPMN_073674 [Dreissena polymorpha]|uniref:Uncharacterized protein n=1 Tax=Dreissena polymorpha TaxID=45954 RepID=A0A9D4BZL3_DREPO|nr:hypothetical protein DPMN_073674 [Dreissena polymorpha]
MSVSAAALQAAITTGSVTLRVELLQNAEHRTSNTAGRWTRMSAQARATDEWLKSTAQACAIDYCAKAEPGTPNLVGALTCQVPELLFITPITYNLSHEFKMGCTILFTTNLIPAIFKIWLSLYENVPPVKPIFFFTESPDLNPIEFFLESDETIRRKESQALRNSWK